MIRFRRLFDLATDADRRRLAEVQAIFINAFPYEAEVAARIPPMIEGRADFETILLIAEDDHRAVRGFTLTLFFPELRYAYLYYIASHPERPARGIGGALYEATRELLSAKGRSEEHTSELQSLMRISYAVFCLKKQISKDYSYIRYNNTQT